ncbi:hypothetical protein HDE_09558 [Halotydeus destructor]|nr:hypothetical protein HDE_09558 [Halotydeus destructor]
MSHIKVTPVRIALPTTSNAPATAKAESLAGYAAIYRKTNFTFQLIESLGVGYRLDNGSYTGLLGELMRNRSDIAVLGTVLSSFKFPGIVPGPAQSSLSLKVHSKVEPKVLEQTDVLTSIETLPLEFKIYLFVVVHIVAGSGIRVTKNGVSQYAAASSQAIRCFVSQGNLQTESSARATLSIHFAIFAFVTVFGYILNMMSTDTFVLKQSRRIETLADVFDPYFDDVRFKVFKNDLFFNYLQQAKKNTILGQVYDKVQRESDCSRLSTCSFFEIDGQIGSSQQLEMLEMANNVSEQGGMATFVTDELIENLILPILCRSRPELTKMVYTGPQVITEDIMVNSMRSNMDQQVERYLRYVDTSLLEFQLAWMNFDESLHASLDIMAPRSRDLNYLHCISRFMPEKEQILVGTGLAAYKRLTANSSYIVLGALLVLLAELVVFSCRAEQKRQEKRTKRTKRERSWFEGSAAVERAIQNYKRLYENPSDEDAPKSVCVRNDTEASSEMDDVRPQDTQQCSQTTPQEPVQSQTLTMLQYIKTIMTTISGKKLLDTNDQSGLDQAVSFTDTLMEHFSSSSGSELMPAATWEKRFERLEAIVASKFTTPSYSEVAKAQQERESATSIKVKSIQAVPTLTLKLDINDGVTLIPQGLKEALKDTISTRHGDRGVSRMRFLGKRSLLIVTRDVEAKSYLESQIRTKMKDLCSISEPFYKMPTVRIEGLDNHDSGEELKAVLQHKFPQHAEKIKIILLHKTHSGNQQTAIVRVPKEIYANLVTTDLVRDRFRMSHIKVTPVRIALPTTGNVPPTAMAKSLANYAAIYKKTNSTLQPIASLGVGYRLDNGNYTGLLGELMRNVSDIAICGTVLSSFNFPGIAPGPALSSLSLKVHSQVKPKVLEPTDVLTSIQTLPLEFKIYLFVVGHIVAGSSFRDINNGVSQYTAASFQALRCFVSQGDLQTEPIARATLSIPFAIFAFVTVSGYILNMMSTDAFVVKQPRRIETLADAFDPFFDDVRFMVFKNDLFFNYVHQTNKNTILGQVYDKMQKESDCSHLSTCSLVEFDGQLGSSQQLEAFEIAKNASQRGGMATFATDELLELFILPTLCRFQPGMAKMVYTGLAVFTEDVMVNSMRSDIDEHVGRYLRYVDSSLFEFHLVWMNAAESVHASLDTMAPLSRDLNYRHCISRLMSEKEEILVATGIAAYKRLDSKFVVHTPWRSTCFAGRACRLFLPRRT